MVDEALVLGIIAVIAGVLLVAGLVQALRAPPRRRVRPGRTRGRTRVPVRRGGAPGRSLLTEPAPSPPPAAATVSSPAADSTAPERLPLEECLAFYEAKQYHDVLLVAEPRLQQRRAGGAEPTDELAALWGLVGLCRQALNDEDGARDAFEEAIGVAPDADRSRYENDLAALAGGVAQRLLARAEALGEAAEEERLNALRHAVLWLRRGVTAAPGDEGLTASLDRAREQLWVAYGRAADVLMQRREFRSARRLLREALTDDELPEDWRVALENLLAAAEAGETGGA